MHGEPPWPVPTPLINGYNIQDHDTVVYMVTGTSTSMHIAHKNNRRCSIIIIIAAATYASM